MNLDPKKTIAQYEKILRKQLPYEVKKSEDTEIITTNKDNEYTMYNDIPFYHYNEFLYHGIRNQIYLEKLENIFKEKKILAGKYIKNYYKYSDNCNKGEYVSLLKAQNTSILAFQTFIEENISLLITPYCDAIETKYVDFNTWEKVKDLNLKQIYSYLPGECMCKDYIPLEYVKAIGVPYIQLMRTRGRNYADKLLEDIVLLMDEYNISLPIVEPGRMNAILVSATIEKNNGIKR